MASVIEAAKAYRHDLDENEWVELCVNLATCLASSIGFAFSDSDEADVANIIAESCFYRLVALENAWQISDLNNVENAIALLSSSVANTLIGNDSYIDELLYERFSPYGEFTADLVQDEYDGPSLLQRYNVEADKLDLTKIGAIIREALPVARGDAETPTIQTQCISLEVIDRNLYTALAKDPQLLQGMNWRMYEKLLADILETHGYEIDLKKGTKDGGIDIIALKRSDQFGEHKYLVQAKRWKHSVGVEPVRQLLFLHNHYHASKSCLAATGRFTGGALELANEYRWQLALRDLEGIQQWVTDTLKIK